MKSAYGFKEPAEDYELTHVEPGSPMGELLRRYWQPVALSEDLKDLPKKVKILCEEVVLFRTKAGQVGCLLPHCTHRGASLEWGRIEEKGIRCCYHGWLFTPEGQAIEMPCEPAGTCERMKAEQPGYPALEFGGLVFVYMGPLEKKPPFPLYDVYDTADRDIIVVGRRLWDGQGIGYVKDCNWLQAYENVVDPWHLLVLHQQISGDQFNGALMQGSSSIGFERTSLGVRYNVTKDLPNGNRLVRYAETVLPNVLLVPNVHEKGIEPKRKDMATEFTWMVPVDNTEITSYSLIGWPAKDGKPDPAWRPGTDLYNPERPAALQRSYEERQRAPDDREAQEGQRPIAIHALERLGHSDLGVVMLRRSLREQLRTLQDGRDPMNIFRDSNGGAIETHAWNTILSRDEAAVHQGEEC